MDIGIGLPNSVIGTRGPELVDWAREAEGAGFSSLGTIDRIAYPSHEPLVSLAAAAAVTERIGLLTSILLAPLRINTALFAKQSSTVNAISGGRLTLGLAVGGREDDFEASGVDFSTRGRAFDRQLEELHELWNGKEVGIGGPVTPDGAPTVILGGSVSRIQVTTGDCSDSLLPRNSVAEMSLRPAVRSNGTVIRLVDPTGTSTIGAAWRPASAR